MHNSCVEKGVKIKAKIKNNTKCHYFTEHESLELKWPIFHE